MDLGKLLEQGLMSRLSGNQIKILMTLSYYKDESKLCKVSVKDLSGLTGLSDSTVNKLLKELVEAHLIYKVGSYYSFEYMESKEHDYQLAKVIAMYRAKYKEVYGNDPTIVYGRDMNLLKRLEIRSKYSYEDVKTIINIGVGEYKDRWESYNYPLPTLGVVFSWIAPLTLDINNSRKSVYYDESCNDDKSFF